MNITSNSGNTYSYIRSTNEIVCGISEFKDKCVIEITSKVMSDPVVLKSKLVEISYEVFYQLDEKGGLVFDGRCGDTRFSDLLECSWQSTCSGGSASVVKFHNER